MSSHPFDPSRRGALKCLAFGGAGIAVRKLAGGVLTPVQLRTRRRRQTGRGERRAALSSDQRYAISASTRKPTPMWPGTLKQTIEFVNAMPVKPALAIHTRRHHASFESVEFDLAAQLLSGLPVTELHTVPGEHDVDRRARSRVLPALRQGVEQQG